MPTPLSQAIETLRETLAALPAPAPGRRRTYPAAIRTQTARLFEQGVSLNALSRETGLRMDLLKRWDRAARVKKTSTVQPAPRVFAIESQAHAADRMPREPFTPPPSAAPLRLQLGAFVVTITLAEMQR